MDQLVHVNQLIAHAISFIIFLFLVRGAFNTIILPPMRERRERIRAEFERIEQEKAEVQKIRQEYEAQSGGQAQLDPAAFFGQDQNALDRMTTEFARTIVSAILEAF